jgi:hypothetical protein
MTESRAGLSQAAVERVNEDRRAWDAFAAAALSRLTGEHVTDEHAAEKAAVLADLMMEKRRLRHAKPPATAR